MINTTNKTRLLGIIGTPVEHTLSPDMHSMMANRLGFDFAYLAFDVKNDAFKSVVAAAKAMDARGFNITSPYKIEVMDCIDEIDSDALLMGTVNTIVNDGGKWTGYNTDGDGFANSLEAEGTELCGKRVLMLGAGGSARSVAYKLAKKKVSQISMSARNSAGMRVIGDMLEKHTDTRFSEGISPNTDYDIIINTTPLGMFPHERENPLAEPDIISKKTTVCDLIYNPGKTLLLSEAEKRGARLVNGLSMLVMQGIYAFELFCGRKLPQQGELYDMLMNYFGNFKLD